MSTKTIVWLRRRLDSSEKMGSREFVKKVYVSESVGPNSRGRLPGRCRDRVKEYMCEKGATRRGRAGSSKEGVFGQGEVETLLL